ncbi:MAG: DUF438 domain-containing protein [Candidatus Heimdallarchaeota archaeon]|nr:DUF438 domain-containing protein [Candidatus Heimdallarchaeota archaeon]
MSKLILSEATKIMDVIDEYPFLTDVLVELDPILRRFKNPILRKTVGRRATLTDVSDMINRDLNEVISFFSKKIEEATSTKVELNVGSERISGWENEHTRKREMLKALVLELHAEGDLQTLKARFKEIIGDIEATDIASMEQELIDSGELTVDQITLLCDLHVGIFEDTLAENKKPQTVPGHPIHTYMAENSEAKKIIAKLRENPSPELIKELAKIEIHYTRLENQLFPMLEKKDFAGPSQVMWAKHDETRQLFREGEDVDLEELTSQVEDMTFKEETILFPTSLELLTTLDWQTVKHGEEEIGFAWVTPGDEWKPLTPDIIHQTPTPDITADTLDLNTGKLTLEQIDLMLTHLPIEISYINTQDEVLYYSGTKERIFPRSPGVIGRKVQKCHPPKSLEKVIQIIEAFRSGRKDQAEFWITMEGKFLHIRYFAVRDDNGKYQGTIEVMQDVTSIRALEGERRLVNWED